MLTIAEKEVMKRMARLAMLEEDLIKREMKHYNKRAFKERPRDEMGRWLPNNHETSLEEMEEELQSESTRKIRISKDKEKDYLYHVKDASFTIEDLKSLLAVIGVLGAFLLAVFT